MIKIDSLSGFLSNLKMIAGGSMLLYRGQSQDDSLLPGIARKKSGLDTTELEKKMLSEVKRRGNLLVTEKLTDDWDWLVYAQHFGLSTRLLDWTSNPLVALWFAISSVHYLKGNSYLYLLIVNEDNFLSDLDRNKGPFGTKTTKVLRPIINNKRIVAQQGWFTSHVYSTKLGKFVGIEKNKQYGKNSVIKFSISSNLKLSLLNELDILGINYQSLFPDFTGLCNQINWEYYK